MLSMRAIGLISAVAGLALVVAIAASEAQTRRNAEIAAVQASAAAADADKAAALGASDDVSCTAGGWIRSMHRVGDSYAVELADGTTGTMPAADAEKICGHGTGQ